ncbi:RNA polymerase sigma factor [Paenibacillus sp. DMB20]|uniref:RNA polymerase sigma factor n=1 Tax=Paenibacillus sp. DMB20 TaxID=1642570 RepID=UPI001F3DCB90|nr:sigma-70 family RNA polymerase sigma factor [Paenibacillus sp. DMB20]
MMEGSQRIHQRGDNRVSSNRLQLLLAAEYNEISEPLQEEVYYEFYDLVYGQIMYVVREHAAVEDIIQEAFIKVITNKPVFDNESKLKAWLRVVTKNTTMNYLRKNKKYRNQIDVDRVFICEEELVASSTNVEHQVESKMMEESIIHYLEQLKPEYRVLIEYRWKHGLSYREIAELLDTREEIVKQRLFRARESVKKMLYREWGVMDEQRKI